MKSLRIMRTKSRKGFVGPCIPFRSQSNMIFTLIPSTPYILHENIRQKLPAINATSYHQKVFVNLIDFNKQNKHKHYFDLISNKYAKTFTHISYQNLHMGGSNQYYSILAMHHSIKPQIDSILKCIFLSNEI